MGSKMTEVGSGSGAYRAGVALAVLAAFLTVWTTIVRDDGNGAGFFMVIMAVGVGWFACLIIFLNLKILNGRYLPFDLNRFYQKIK